MYSQRRKRKSKIPLIACIVLLLLSIASLTGAVIFNRSAAKADKKAEEYQAQLKEAQKKEQEVKGELQAKQEYIDQWDGIYQQLAQQGDAEAVVPDASTGQAVEGYDSPYKDIHPDLWVTAEDTQAADPNQKLVHLTFDDGPSKYTSQVLDALDVYGIKATFFVTYTENPELQQYYKEIVNRGHTIAIHTASHDYKNIYASVENYLEDFYKVYQLVSEQTGVKPTLFRYPGGSTSLNKYAAGAGIAKEMENRGFVYFDWNVSSGDGGSKATQESVLQSITTNVVKYQESIVLMHDTREPTVTILPEVLKQLVEMGCKFEPLSQESRPIQFYAKKY